MISFRQDGRFILFSYINISPLTLLLLLNYFLFFTHALSLSPLESAMLNSRLIAIKEAVAQQEIITIDPQVSTFIFPGAGGVDELVLELQQTILQEESTCQIIDWKQHRGSILTAAYDGEAVGESIATKIIQQCQQESLLFDEDNNNKKKIKKFHLIGISVGAFCANAAATILYQHNHNNNVSNNNQIVQLTLLDPFCSRGVTNPKYGQNQFGLYATSALQILNTDDPVPTTNDPLPNCHCIDVTNAPEREKFVPPPGDSMHSWPLAYYARYHYAKEKKKLLQNNNNDHQELSSLLSYHRGTIETIS